MSIVLAGISHKTAPVEVRERLALTDEMCARSLRALVDGELIREALIVSTCNRVEVLAELNPSRLAEGEARLSQFLSEVGSAPSEYFDQHLYLYTRMEAVRHLFRVASSLDSMVVGEPQILGQVRHAYQLAVEAGTAGRVLHRLMHHAFHTAKRVRTETEISAHAVSISYTAIELGRKVFGSLAGRTVMLVGAGEMALLSARHLRGAGATRLLIANRTQTTAAKLAAEFDAEVIPFDELAKRLSEADIVICSTSAGGYLISPEMTRAALDERRNRPIFFIDISVPRNVDPRVGEISNLFVFDVDDLEAVALSNLREREREAERAENIIESEVAHFEQCLRQLEIGPKIGALRKRFQDIARAELERQRHRLGNLSLEQERALEALLVSTANKISHPVMEQMRRSGEAVEEEFADLWRPRAAAAATTTFRTEKAGAQPLMQPALSRG